MYLIKNFRNYIPVLTMLIVITFLSIYLNQFMYHWPHWTEMLVVILPFIFVPTMNVISMILYTHKLKKGKKLYISILFSYVLQLLSVLILMIESDPKGMWILQSYSFFLLVIDAITFVYPCMIYPNRK